HSSRSARDRDRLREAVLKDRGWRIHRVWSTDWFHRPDEQLRRIVAALEMTRSDADAGEEAGDHDDSVDSPLLPSQFERVDSPEDSNGDVGASWVTPYVESAFDVPKQTPIHETSLSVLSKIVSDVVRIEGPIHRDEVARRITSLWGQQRTGARIA